MCIDAKVHRVQELNAAQNDIEYRQQKAASGDPKSCRLRGSPNSESVIRACFQKLQCWTQRKSIAGEIRQSPGAMLAKKKMRLVPQLPGLDNSWSQIFWLSLLQADNGSLAGRFGGLAEEIAGNGSRAALCICLF